MLFSAYRLRNGFHESISGSEAQNASRVFGGWFWAILPITRLYVKGTGFSPYIHGPKTARASAPEGEFFDGLHFPQRLKPQIGACTD
jgi:hypothetical protein